MTGVDLNTGAIVRACLFRTCIDLLSLLEADQSLEDNKKVSCLKIDLQKARLLLWGDTVGILRVETDGRALQLKERATEGSITKLLEQIQSLLTDKHKLQNDFGLRPSAALIIDKSGRNVDVLSTVAMNVFERSYQRISNRFTKLNLKPSNFSSTKWVIHDTKKFHGFVTDLENFIDSLYHLLPVDHPSTNQAIRDSISNLRVAQGAIKGDYKDWSDCTSDVTDGSEIGSVDRRHVEEWIADADNIDNTVDNFMAESSDKELRIFKDVPSSLTESNISTLAAGLQQNAASPVKMDGLENDNDSDMSLAESIFSTDQLSDSSCSSTHGSQNAVNEISVLLVHDEVLCGLYPIAFQRMSVKAFTKRFYKLLKAYCVDLSLGAHDTIEVETVQFLRPRLRQFIRRIVDEFGPEDKRRGRLNGLIQQSVRSRLEKVETFLNEVLSSAVVNIEHHLEIYSDESDSDDDGQDPDFIPPNVARLKNFLLSGLAWSNLRKGLQEVVGVDTTEISQADTQSEYVGLDHSATPVPGNLISKGVRRVFWQTLLPQNTVRIEWTCRCGHSGSDDYQERTPGGVSELMNDLMMGKAIVQANATIYSASAVTRWFRATKNLTLRISRGLQCSPNTPTLPTCRSTADSLSTSGSFSTESDQRFLLFCVDSESGRKVPIFENIDVCNIKSDRELFSTLKERYLEGIGGFSRSSFRLRNIHFVEFEVRPKHYIDCLEFNRVPPDEKNREYEWETAKTVPPVGSKWMMHIFDCPEDASDDTICMQRFPKKIKDMLEFSRGGENKGWSIYFEEEILFFSKLPFYTCVTGVVFSLLFAMCWTVLQQDLQGAFGVASWITSVVPLILIARPSWVWKGHI